MQAFRTSLLAATAAALITAGAKAQVDFLYTNISSSLGHYYDCIALHDGASSRPLAQETNLRTATGSVQKLKFRLVDGRPFVYWIDTISDDIWRATDRNKNGALDPSEFQQLFDFDAASNGQIDELQGTWWGSCGAGSGTTAGLWKFQDATNDGDFMDAGESTRVIAAPTFSFGTSPAYTASSDDIRAVGILPNGDVIWHEDDNRMWFRTTPAGVTSIFLVYKTTAVIAPAPPANPDFGTMLPAVAGQLDRVGVDTTNGTVYLAPNFTASEPYVFAARDQNNDGDVNDAGEVKLFFDGNSSTPAWGPIDDIECFGGAVWVSYEIDPANDPGSQFVGLRDLNNDGDAMDAGELTNMGRTAATDDPTAIGITVAPKGMLGSGCVNVDLRATANLSTAGGTLSYQLQDIPSALQNEKTAAFVFLSATGDAALPVPLPPYNCVMGLTPDVVFTTFAGFFSSAELTGRTAAITPSLPYPAGLPAGLKLFGAALCVRATDFQARGVSQTNLLVVQ